ncbi:MAG TPA: hypothetical protein VJ850_13815 [Candidatus Limnocylindrales bacterium]|nr:hypothetical protein [Candidatus Limnocylindrales bacterium]
MSKRHSASRRRAYGRRQHEVHERLDRRTDRIRTDRAWRAGQDLGLEPASFIDTPSADAPYGFAD